MANALAVHTDSRISEFLNYRGIDSRATWERDLAVGLPWAELPEWAQFGERSWAHSMHRLIVPLRDAAGVTRSVLARSVEKQPLVKSVAPRGYARSGLVMANQCALMMLRNKAKPNIVVVREGELDFVHEALLDDTVAVLGIVSGSWTSEIASRIPVGAHVVVATDADAAGDKYADAIMASLQGRGSLERRRDAA
jgi:DNA primase